MNTVIICRTPIFHSRRILQCPTCKTRRRFLITDRGIWYAPTLTCLGCGDTWSEEGRMGRPFARGWRQRAITDAQTKWTTAGTERQRRAWLRNLLKEERNAT